MGRLVFCSTSVSRIQRLSLIPSVSPLEEMEVAQTPTLRFLLANVDQALAACWPMSCTLSVMSEG